MAAELADAGRPGIGLTGTIASDLPAGAGLSSSAALEVALALALCAVADVELEPLELALLCQRAELRAVGVPCGILDQAACLLGTKGHAILLDCHSLEYRLIHVPSDAGLLIVDSGVPRSLENTAYAERRSELEEALRLAGAARSTEVDTGALDGLDDVPKRRLRHVVTENERVRLFATAFEAGDLAAAGVLLRESHVSLRDDYEVSIPELDLLVELAIDAGALGARLLGGGFGGAVLVLAHTQHAGGSRKGDRGPVPGTHGNRRRHADRPRLARRERQPSRLAAPARSVRCEDVREAVAAAIQPVPRVVSGPHARRAEPSLRMVEAEHGRLPGLQVARVSRL